jgi:nucleoside-diphosphate-sugar epimerase|tara:strand:- start:14593 stop:15315 length:723 start_codon:yes stop_codon:yes gene_type:complete
MKLLILGGTGYLGWQLYQDLKKRYSCTIGKRVKNNIYIKNFRKYIKSSDIIFFLAGPSHKQIKKKNVLDRKKILKKIKKDFTKEKLIIYYSTSAKFSKDKKKFHYIQSHKLAKDYLKKNFNRSNFKIIRLSNVFGLKFLPKKKNIKSSPINFFMHKIIKNKKIKLKTPNALRSWITLSSFLKISNDIILNRVYSKIKSEKLKVNTFLNKLYFLYNKKTNLKNSFNKEIVETFKILKKLNY